MRVIVKQRIARNNISRQLTNGKSPSPTGLQSRAQSDFGRNLHTFAAQTGPGGVDIHRGVVNISYSMTVITCTQQRSR